ncbi:nephrocystin-1 [Mustelus asterias]
MALRKGPLRSVQLTTDRLQGQVDVLLKEVKQPDKREKMYERCVQLKKSVDETLVTLRKLKKTNELSLISNYDQRKLAEERRLTGMSELVGELVRRLDKERAKHKVDNADKRTKSQTTGVIQGRKGSDKDDEEEDDEDEESEEDDEDEGEEFDTQVTMQLFITISDYVAQEESDLAFKKGEILRILDQRFDGWWLGENAQGKKGLVPKTYLQVLKQQNKGSINVVDASKPESSVAGDEDDDDEDDEDDENDYESESDDDDDEEYDPHSVKEVSEARSERTQLHRIAVKKVVSEISATEVLKTTGNIPEGFRASTLAQLLEDGTEFHMSSYLQPKLTQSKLSFEDIQWDKAHGGLHPRKSFISLKFTLWSARMIPLPGSAVQVLSRQIRFCLFDGQRVLSNIHTVRATWHVKNPKSWTFSPRVTGILPSMLDGDCFVRSNSQSPRIGILFELGITYFRSSTGHQGELSCGWAFLELFTANGDAVPHRTYEMVLNGGTPYEKGLEVDPTVSKRATLFGQLMATRKQPKLLIKLKSPTKKMRNILNLLPETLVGPSCCTHLLAFYRQLLADALLKDRVNVQKADLIGNPVLATFPEVLEQTDILDALRSAWSEKEVTLSRPEKRDAAFLKSLFIQVYHDSAYPLLRSTTLPTNRWADDEIESSRWKAIADFLQESQKRDGSLYSLLSPEHAYQVFDVSEISYDFLGLGRSTVVAD